MNYYKQFAEMLGLEFEQEFVLTDVDGKMKDKYTYKITEDGLLYKSPPFINWSISSSGTIGKLLDGYVKAVSKQWKPEKGGKYWTYSEIWEEVTSFRWEGYYYDLLLWKVGNCFKTRDEAEYKGKEIMEQIQKEYEEA